MRIFHAVQDGGDGSATTNFFAPTDTVNEAKLEALLTDLCNNNEAWNQNDGGPGSFNIPDGDHDISLTDIMSLMGIDETGDETEGEEILQDNLQDA